MGAQPDSHACAHPTKGEECQCASQTNEDQLALDLATLPADNPPPYNPPPYEVAIQDQAGSSSQPQASYNAEYHLGDEKRPSGLTHDSFNESGEPSWRIETPALPVRLRDATNILSKPIALPTVRSAQGSPYIRAYPLELAKVGIARETFLSFLDHVNRVVADNPPLVAVGLVGSVIGLVPEPTAQLAGTVIELAANTTNVALAEGRTELLLRKANNDIFHPVGLQVRIAKLEAVAKIAGMPFLDPETGKLTSGLRILAPLDEEREMHTLSAQHRRLRDLEQWLSPLDLDELPEVEKPNSVMGKMHVKMSEFQRKMEEEELMKMRKKSQEKYAEAKQNAQERYERKMRDLDRRVEKAGRRLGKDGRKQSFDEETGYGEADMHQDQQREREDSKQQTGESSGGSSRSQTGLDRTSTNEDITGKSARKEEKEKKKLEKRAEKDERRAEREEHRAEERKRREIERDVRRADKEKDKDEERRKKEAERDIKRTEREKERNEERKKKEVEREHRRREEKEREREKEAKRAEKKVERALTRAEEKRAEIKEEYEKELRKRGERYEKKDREERAVKKINWLIITDRNMMERSIAVETVLHPERIAEGDESRSPEDSKKSI